ncbi:hypothetical protein M885DRAFT_462058 [Pelagophyceae sp. CCMP2097]|nr:hypothetical protein M885DRAFT_462058 [Pelagophyceae sp. CCMP2097]
MADELEVVVRDICAACAGRGARVPEALAAFVARNILESDAQTYPPDSPLAAAELDSLVSAAVHRLLQHDDPALETIKMQVAFDSAYVRLDAAVEATQKSRSELRRNLVRGIVAVKPKGAADFETLTALYRQIFNFLIETSRGGQSSLPKNLGDNGDDAAATLRAAEREVAAALESVFPRIGLKAFMLLSSEEKRAQLEELARIVTGIRLFNRESGKGGAGLARVEDAVVASLNDLRAALDSETAELHHSTQRYQETLVYCHLRQPPGVTAEAQKRWGSELCNRRQYAAYLTSLSEDAASAHRRVSAHRQRLSLELDELQALVGGRASVPKEHVYPKFDAVATAWFALDDEMRLVESRIQTLNELHAFGDSFVATLGAHNATYRSACLEAQQKRSNGGAASVADDEAEMALAVTRHLEEQAVSAAPAGATAGEALEAAFESDFAGVSATAVSAPKGGVPEVHNLEGGLEGLGLQGAGSAQGQGGPGSNVPVLLSVETTPEFLQLPLEYQGFCGWTVAKRHGLLLPGKPALGVVKYKGASYVFAHAVALQAFMDQAESIRAGVVSAAKAAPELVHLLRLEHDFPGTSIAKILAKSHRTCASSALLHAPTQMDASTETPLHFVERHVDPKYEWNDWSLRRQALKITKLKKCLTSSQQTDSSQYRQAATTQVYLPVDARVEDLRGDGEAPAAMNFGGPTKVIFNDPASHRPFLGRRRGATPAATRSR